MQMRRIRLSFSRIVTVYFLGYLSHLFACHFWVLGNRHTPFEWIILVHVSLNSVDVFLNTVELLVSVLYNIINE